MRTDIPNKVINGYAFDIYGMWWIHVEKPHTVIFDEDMPPELLGLEKRTYHEFE